MKKFAIILVALFAFAVVTPSLAVVNTSAAVELQEPDKKADEKKADDKKECDKKTSADCSKEKKACCEKEKKACPDKK